MHQEIWKYTLQLTDVQAIEMPKGAKILTLQVQHSTPHIWVLVDPESPKVSFVIETYKTGVKIPATAVRDYIGTYQLHNSILVFHCFNVLLDTNSYT